MAYCEKCGFQYIGAQCNRCRTRELVRQKASDEERPKTWRERNPEAYRKYMREYMRKRRAKE